MKVIFLSYDGLTDPLGQSQVLPYIIHLSDRGFDITIVSFEKKRGPTESRLSVQEKLDEKKIKWVPINYISRPTVISALLNVLRLKRQCIRLQKKYNYHVIHCRSYIPSLVGIPMKRRFGLKLVFDTRGFYADERVEGGLWDQKKIVYRFIYHYFKRMEKVFFSSADKIVTLTEAAKKIVSTNFSLPASAIRVIPCCVDTDLFDPGKINLQLQNDLKKKLSIGENDFVLSYLGMIGTWYLLDEMLDFFKRLIVRYPSAKFLFVTYHPPEEIIELAIQKNIPKEKIIVVRALRNEVPLLLSLSNLSIFFIMPTFSKIASSPTKQAELLAMGIPLVCNTRIGDTEEFINASGAGILIDTFTNEQYDKAINAIPRLLEKDKNEIRNYAIEMFSLDRAVRTYQGIYNELEKDS